MAEQELRSDEERRAEEEEAAERRKLRQRLAERAEAVRAAATAADAAPGGGGENDAALGLRLLSLGFDEGTAPLLPYLPLIQVAWADGAVAKEERARIFRALKEARLPIGGPAWTLAEALLEEQPSPVFLEESRRLLQGLLGRGGQARAASEARAIMELCLEVASASGGLLGRWWRTSAVEVEAIKAVAEALGPEAVARYKLQFGAG